MPFVNSCFISYRHSDAPKNRSRIEQLTTELKAELEWRVNVPVPAFMDIDRLKGGDFYQEKLAYELCRSVCMIVLYWPSYFSREHPFCSREFKLMEQLESARLEMLTDAERQKGLIIVIALRDFEGLPTYISARRNCYNFEPYTLSSRLLKSGELDQKLNEIAQYIAGRCRVFSLIPEPPDPCESCPKCKLPGVEDIHGWLDRLLTPNPPFPLREPGR